MPSTHPQPIETLQEEKAERLNVLKQEFIQLRKEHKELKRKNQELREKLRQKLEEVAEKEQLPIMPQPKEGKQVAE